MISDKQIIKTIASEEEKFLKMDESNLETPTPIITGMKKLSFVWDPERTPVPRGHILPQISNMRSSSIINPIRSHEINDDRCDKKLLPPPVITSKLWKRRMERWNALKK